jgi:hypothetical protein
LRTVAIAASAWNVSDAVAVADGVVLLVGPAGGVAEVGGAGVDVPLDAVDAPGAALGADVPEQAVTAASEIATSTLHRAVRMDTASAAAWLAATLDGRLAAVLVRRLAAMSDGRLAAMPARV